MAGHSQFANIKHRKGAQDKKRAKIFTKLVREIIVAAKTGLPDPAFNPRLRLAIANGKAASLPKDRIEAAIKKATGAGADADNYSEMRYEAYAPGGIALIIESLTDNKNRTVGEVRSTITKVGGSFGESGSVSFMFNRVGIIKFAKAAASDDAIMEAAIEAGANDCASYDEFHEVITEVDNFNDVREVLTKQFGDAESASLSWRAKDLIEVDFEKAEVIENLIEKLEDLDDVQYVCSNHTFSLETAQKLAEKA
jgi:YebC/PmpR family DNA-binding regulatory protein